MKFWGPSKSRIIFGLGRSSLQLAQSPFLAIVSFFCILNELTSQVFNELHPLPNEVTVLHEHLCY